MSVCLLWWEKKGSLKADRFFPGESWASKGFSFLLIAFFHPAEWLVFGHLCWWICEIFSPVVGWKVNPSFTYLADMKTFHCSTFYFLCFANISINCDVNGWHETDLDKNWTKLENVNFLANIECGSSTADLVVFCLLSYSNYHHQTQTWLPFLSKMINANVLNFMQDGPQFNVPLHVFFLPCQCTTAGTRWCHLGKYPPHSLNCTLRVGDPTFCDPCGSDFSVISCNCVALERTGLHYFLHCCTVQKRMCELKRKIESIHETEEKQN